VSPVPMFFTILVFLITLAATRYVSLGSIIAALTYPIFTYIWNQPLQLKILSVILALIIVVKHKSNIIRIINGVENKIPEIFKNKK
ncbi:glycerol-3-phosphate acyltransferase, partial [Candidatus Dependentiae bacterium]|nr:glycerol-3-phosphate acyltransferase [Candidatus Dependentiae bacterium]